MARGVVGTVVAGLTLAVAPAVLGGCTSTAYPTSDASASAASPGSGTSAASPATSATASPAAAPTPPVGTRPVVDCLNGTYRLSALVDVGPGAAYVSGKGGDVELRFTGEEFPDGNYVGTRYRLVAAGKQPITLTAPDGSTRSLLVTAKAEGSYFLENSVATFARGPGTGSGRLSGGDATQTLTLEQVQTIVTPVGPTTVSCTRTELYLTGETTQLTLTAA